jgi:uncharacterized protein DUF6317
VTSGFHVFLPGLVTAAHSFAQQATNYESVMPDGGFGCPRGGDEAIDRLMNLLVIALGNTHSVIANTMESHAWKLQEAHDSYDRNESDVVAGILKIAYEHGYPIDDPRPGGGDGGTFVPYPLPGGKTVHPNPLPPPESGQLDTAPQWNDLKYWYFETLGLGYGGPPATDPWIGGDLRGMWNLAQQLRTFAYQSGHGEPSGGSIAYGPGTVIAELNSTVRTLLTQSGEDWHGTAAVNFSSAYSNDAACATVVANVAWDSADAIIALVWQLYGYQTQLETFAQQFADRGYRLTFDAGDSDHFAPAATSTVTSSWDWHSARDSLRDLYNQLEPHARENRQAAAKALSHQYEILVDILRSFQEDNNGRVHEPNLNDNQWRSLNDNVNNLQSLQNSDDYKKAGSDLHLDWVGAGKSALSQAASHGKWKSVAAPIVEIILTLITVA